MTAYDACFLAIACASLQKLPSRWWLVAVAPNLAWGIGLLPLGTFAAPVVALIVCAPLLPLAPCALLLVVPAYASPQTALLIGALWLVATVAFERLASARLDDPAIPMALRGTPARLLALGALYFALHPLAYL